jgi:hypothetical protein
LEKMITSGHADRDTILSLHERLHTVGDSGSYVYKVSEERIRDLAPTEDTDPAVLSPLVVPVASALTLEGFGTGSAEAVKLGVSVLEFLSRIVSRYMYSKKKVRVRDEWIATLVHREVISVAEAVTLCYLAHNNQTHYSAIFESLMHDMVWIPEQWQKDQFVRCWLYTVLHHPGKTISNREYVRQLEDDGEVFYGVPEPIVAGMLMTEQKYFIEEEEHELLTIVYRTYASIMNH